MLYLSLNAMISTSKKISLQERFPADYIPFTKPNIMIILKLYGCCIVYYLYIFYFFYYSPDDINEKNFE